jgi:hypothetical protein
MGNIHNPEARLLAVHTRCPHIDLRRGRSDVPSRSVRRLIDHGRLPANPSV